MCHTQVSAREKCDLLVDRYYIDRGVMLKNRAFESEILSNISSNSRVLDAGCGRKAPVISKYSSLIGEAIGVDLIEDFEVKAEIKPYTADLESLPFEDDYFDVVVSREVCEHLENPIKVFRELKRVVKPKGKIIMLTPNKYCYSSLISKCLPTSFKTLYLKKVFGENAYDNFPTFYRCNTRWQIKKIAGESSLTLEKLMAIRHYPYYFMFSVILFRLGILYDELISALGLDCLKSSFIFVLTKKET